MIQSYGFLDILTNVSIYKTEVSLMGVNLQ